MGAEEGERHWGHGLRKNRRVLAERWGFPAGLGPAGCSTLQSRLPAHTPHGALDRKQQEHKWSLLLPERSPQSRGEPDGKINHTPAQRRVKIQGDSGLCDDK